MRTGRRWRFVGLGIAILGLFAFSFLNDSWPGDVALGVALFVQLGVTAFNWRGNGFLGLDRFE